MLSILAREISVEEFRSKTNEFFFAKSPMPSPVPNGMQKPLFVEFSKRHCL
jgi:hypothetical protein